MMKGWLVVGLMVGSWAIAPQTLAQSRLEVNREDPIRNQTLQDGNVRVVVNYEPGDDPWIGDLEYEIFYGETSWVDTSSEFAMFGAIALQDLDSDGHAEVIVETYSGGAHCCTTHEVFSWGGDGFAVASTGMRDGGGGTFEDLNDDGFWEFVAFDNSFLYAFSSYAGSFPPSQIYTFQNGNWVETTRQFPEHLRGHAWRMFQAIEERQNDTEINGVLAGYVAQKILLGEYEAGWELMLARYNPDSSWGMDIYNDEGEVAGTHPDFPTALRAFLIETGYLLSDGTPR